MSTTSFKIILLTTLCVSAASCFSQKGDVKRMKPYMDMITADELSGMLHFLASDYFEGRGNGTPGQAAAANYIASQYMAMGVPPWQPVKGEVLRSYFQEFSFESRGQKGVAQNVMAFIEGSDPVLKKEIVVLSAHYDHLGRDSKLEGDQIFNGAADDGSGTVGLLEVAESFITAKKNGAGPKRSILFLHCAGEEVGVQGSTHFMTQAQPDVLAQMVADINLDGIGGKDISNPAITSDYVYLLYNDSTSAPLEKRVKELNTATGINLNVAKPLRPELFRSDHASFGYAIIPWLYFSTGLTEHYHKVSDEPQTIDYDHVAKITKLIYATASSLADGESIITFDRSRFALTGKYFCTPCNCKYDNTEFDAPGLCPACKMVLAPVWKKK